MVKDSYPQMAKHKIYYSFFKQTFNLYFLDFQIFDIFVHLRYFFGFLFFNFDEEEKTEQNIVLFLNPGQ